MQYKNATPTGDLSTILVYFTHESNAKQKLNSFLYIWTIYKDSSNSKILNKLNEKPQIKIEICKQML